MRDSQEIKLLDYADLEAMYGQPEGPPVPPHLRRIRFEQVMSEDAETKDWIILRWGGGDYPIEMSRFHSPTDVCEWIVHLAEKSEAWDIHPEDISKFIQKIFHRKGWKLYNSYKDQDKKKWEKEQREKIDIRIRWKVLERDGFACVACGATPHDGAVLHVDHKTPISQWGGSEMNNLQTLCRECNFGKHTSVYHP